MNNLQFFYLCSTEFILSLRLQMDDVQRALSIRYYDRITIQMDVRRNAIHWILPISFKLIHRDLLLQSKLKTILAVISNPRLNQSNGPFRTKSFSSLNLF